MKRGVPDPLLVVALGSNLGHRLGYLEFGVRRLREKGLELTDVSPVFETPPLGSPGEPWFLNMVALGSTRREPLQILHLCKAVESEAGRERSHPNASRTLDLDVVLFGSRIVREPHLTVPHPRWKSRSFVVRPLLSLAPQIVDPETGLTVEEIARMWNQEPQEIRKLTQKLDPSRTAEGECENT